jgi:hypothetical protein
MIESTAPFARCEDGDGGNAIAGEIITGGAILHVARNSNPGVNPLVKSRSRARVAARPAGGSQERPGVAPRFDRHGR